MRVVLCCGDRNWGNSSKIEKALKEEMRKSSIDYVIEGGANGADYLSKKVAQKMKIQVIEFLPNWENLSYAAGPIRNSKQLEVAMTLSDEPLIVLAFHSDIKNSKGTKDMVNKAKKEGVKVRIIT